MNVQEDSGSQFKSGYVRRTIDAELDQLLPSLPAILLDGPKGVGKTETALQRATTVRRLDEVGQRQIAEADPDAVLTGEPPILIDEWHRAPAVWDAVKRAVDARAPAGSFLMTGSSPASGTPGHSGAGRIVDLRMRPLTLPERGMSRPAVSLWELLSSGGRRPISGTCSLNLVNYTDAILASGFPGMQGLAGRALRSQLSGYLARIVDRDIVESGLSVRRPASVRAWLRAYAAATSSTASWERIRDAATSGSDDKPAKTTTIPYIETLTSLRILDEMEAWIPGHNYLSRLNTRPKHHLADPALAAALLGVDSQALLRGNSGPIPGNGILLGALFESLSALTVRVFAQAAEASVYHLRTWEQKEVDMIVERSDARILAVEVKLSASVDDHDVRQLCWLRKRIGEQLIDAIVLNTGPQAYRRKDGVAVVPLGLLGP